MDELSGIFSELRREYLSAESIQARADFQLEVSSAVEHGWARRICAADVPRGQSVLWENVVMEAFEQAVKAKLEACVAEGDAEGAYAWMRQSVSALTLREYADRERVLSESGIRIAASAYAPLVMNCLRETAAMSRVRAWCKACEDGGVLCLLGGTGAGKTVAAAWALCERGGRAVRSDEMAFLSSSNYSADRERFRELSERSGLLVVDDVGTERDADKARHGLFDLVDIRQGRGMRTLLTGNLTPEMLRGALCPRTLSRLRDVGGIYSCPESDMRAARAQRPQDGP